MEGSEKGRILTDMKNSMQAIEEKLNIIKAQVQRSKTINMIIYMLILAIAIVILTVVWHIDRLI